MKVTDFNRLKKLMPMTRSDADGEALMAIRQANKILDASGTNWENVFNRLVTLEVEAGPGSDEAPPHRPYQPQNGAPVRPPPQSAEDLRRRAYINDLLDQVEENARGNFLDFVASLRDQWERTGHLTSLQVDALEKSAARQRR